LIYGHFTILFLEKELKANGEEVSACDDLEGFTWVYDNGFLFCPDDMDMVLEAGEEDESVNSGTVKMAPRTEAIAQRWRILNEYEDEDTEFRPAFAFGSHKMNTEDTEGTKRKCKPFMENDNPSSNDLTFRNIDVKDIVWKRPEEIASIVSETNEKPKFVADGISRFDINQGSIGDCWAVSVIANLASTVKHNPEILDQVFDATPSFDEGNHHFTFKFFKNGQWMEVTVDDYLPWNTAKQKLLFVSSTEKLEFWPCLLEKAYSKFRGSYADMVGGWMSWGLRDMTGIEWTEVRTTEDMYYDICDKLTAHGLVLAACFGSNIRSKYNLVHAHAYSITGFGGDVNQGKCLRVRNPWGAGEYSGEEAHVLNKKMDGEFVIKWEEFVKYFPRLTVKE
jgi:hypothetical protein